MFVVQGCIPSKNKEKTEEMKQKKPEKVLGFQDDLYVKSTETKRRLDLGFRFGKTPTGLEFKTLSGLEVNKIRNYKKVNDEKIKEKLADNVEEEEQETLEEVQLNKKIKYGFFNSTI